MILIRDNTSTRIVPQGRTRVPALYPDISNCCTKNETLIFSRQTKFSTQNTTQTLSSCIQKTTQHPKPHTLIRITTNSAIPSIPNHLWHDLKNAPNQSARYQETKSQYPPNRAQTPRHQHDTKPRRGNRNPNVKNPSNPDAKTMQVCTILNPVAEMMQLSKSQEPSRQMVHISRIWKTQLAKEYKYAESEEPNRQNGAEVQNPKEPD